MRTLAMIAIVMVAGCFSAGSPECTGNEPLVYPGFALYINEAPGLRDGVYQWTVSYDGVTLVRNVTVTKGHGVCDCAVTPSDPAGARQAAELVIQMDRDSAQLALLDDPNGPRNGGPPHVDVAITREGQSIASFTFDPVYRAIGTACQTVGRAQFTADVVGP